MIVTKWQSKIVDFLSFKYGIDKRVVDTVVHYPMLFTKRVMNDPADDTPIRIKHLGVFAYRGSRTKRTFEQPKYDILIQHAEELYDLHYNKDFEDLDQFVEYLMDSFNTADYQAIKKAHEIFKSRIKYADRLKQNKAI